MGFPARSYRSQLLKWLTNSYPQALRTLLVGSAMTYARRFPPRGPSKTARVKCEHQFARRIGHADSRSNCQRLRIDQSTNWAPGSGVQFRPNAGEAVILLWAGSRHLLGFRRPARAFWRVQQNEARNYHSPASGRSAEQPMVRFEECSCPPASFSLALVHWLQLSQPRS